MKQNIILLAAVFLVLLVVAGCGTPPAPLSTNFGTSAPGSTQAAALLLHAPVGTVDLVWSKAQETLRVKLNVTDLAPQSSHPVHLHLGTCQAPGVILAMLSNLVANATGSASLSTTIDHVAQLPRTAYLINIHNGPTMRTPLEQQAIACTPITMKSTGTTLSGHLTLQGTGAPNEAASGIALLSLDHAGTLSVHVVVRGLMPGSAHAVHVHAGSCAEEGKVLFPLNPLVADQQGVATETMTFPHVASIPDQGWYVNVHDGAAVNSQMLFNPIVCGDVRR
jgi:hypothetical protein